MAAKEIKFKVGQHVVYPSHGVGVITGEEVQKVGDLEVKVYVVDFERDRMKLRVPTHRAQAAGLRPVSSDEQIDKVLSTLSGKARVKRGMWSRRAQEYESKINSGNIISLAEVVRDLHRNVDHPDRSYSERMIYENAFERLTGELAVAQKVDDKKAGEVVIKALKKSLAQAAAAKEAREAREAKQLEEAA